MVWAGFSYTNGTHQLDWLALRSSPLYEPQVLLGLFNINRSEHKTD